MWLTLSQRVPLLSAFRYRNYRFYWGGMLASTMGSQIQNVTLLWLVYDLTSSPLQLGLVGSAQGVAQIIFTLTGGSVADRVDRRRLVLLTNAIYAALLLLLAVATAARMATIWYLIAFSALMGVVAAFDQPGRHALIPHLIDDRKDLMNAIAMQSTLWQTARILGPVAAGILITTAGSGPSFLVAAGSFLLMALAMIGIRVTVRESHQERHGGAPILEGVKYVRQNSIFSSIVSMVLVNSLFGMSFVYLLPVFAGEVLQGDSRAYGLLITSMGVGTLTGTLLAANLGRFRKKHLLLLGGSGLFGLLLIMFAFSRSYTSLLVIIAVAGVVQHVYMLTSQVVLQTLVPDEVRGRVMAIYSLVWSLTPLGSLQAGAIANYVSAPVAVAAGGAMVTAFTLFLVFAVPRMRKLEV